MFCFYLSTLLLLTGGIRSNPVPSDFSFEVDSSTDELITVPFGSSAVINCNTNDPHANVSLELVLTGHPDNVPSDDQKITRNGAVFTIHNVIVHDAGKYKCVAERNGQFIKRQIHLIIDTRNPNIAIIPFKSRQVLTGASVSYACEATLGRIYWFRDHGHNSEQLPSQSLLGVSVVSHNQSGIVRKDLVFNNVSSSHDGTYRCKLVYHDKVLERFVQLRVSDPVPVKITDPSKQNTIVVVRPGDTFLKLTCVATGFPLPKLIWKKDGKDIDPCSDIQECSRSHYILLPDGLGIRDPSFPDDDGVFRCEAKNRIAVDKRNFRVILPAEPKLKKPGKTYFEWQSDAELRAIEIPCVLAQGYPKPEFHWSFKTCPYCPLLSVKKKEDTFQVKSEKSTSILKLKRPVRLSHMKFKCVAKNPFGSDSLEFDIVHTRY